MENQKSPVADGNTAVLELLPPGEIPGSETKGAPDGEPVREKIITGLKKRATDALTAADKAMKKYWELMIYIRDNQIPPPVVQEQLKEAGFAASRIAEVKRVAGASHELFELYRKEVIGFRLALQRARGDKKKSRGEKTSDAELFEKAIRHAVEDSVPVAGRFPAWAKRVELIAQGCDVVVTIKRRAST